MGCCCDVSPVCAGEENLQFYGALKGMSRSNVNKLLDCVFQQFSMVNLRRKLVKSYSGGNQRKLSFVVACIGSPSLIFLGAFH